MKNMLPDKKENDEISDGKSDPDANCPENISSPVANMTRVQLRRRVKRDRKIFIISAKLSTFSN